MVVKIVVTVAIGYRLFRALSLKRISSLRVSKKVVGGRHDGESKVCLCRVAQLRNGENVRYILFDIQKKEIQVATDLVDWLSAT